MNYKEGSPDLFVASGPRRRCIEYLPWHHCIRIRVFLINWNRPYKKEKQPKRALKEYSGKMIISSAIIHLEHCDKWVNKDDGAQKMIQQGINIGG